LIIFVFLIRLSFNADPDPASQVNADPGPAFQVNADPGGPDPDPDPRFDD
jgi:hypothetical protein